jgi:hypothetical protein
MRKIIALALPLAAAFALPSPALAQDAGERINQLIIYGDDACPQSTANEITVCARKDESERFRIPEALRGDPNSRKNEPWTDRVAAYETVGAQGIASCSPVGPGGASGCLTRLINAAYAEKSGRQDIRFGQLIEAERAKRLSTIDEDAAATQARVEALEKEYDAKLARERAAEDARVPADLPPPPKN